MPGGAGSSFVITGATNMINTEGGHAATMAKIVG
jgi:hypothetical protein